MIIKTLLTNIPSEHMYKIIKEVLTLFGISVPNSKELVSVDYQTLEVVITDSISKDLSVDITLCLAPSSSGEIIRRSYHYLVHADEHPRAAINRVVKLALLAYLTQICGPVLAPWGILHGVRPTKIVKRFIDMGYSRDIIEKRMQEDFAVSPTKARLITDIAYLQEPFLAPTRDKKLISIYIGIPFCPTKCLYCSFPAGLVPQAQLLRSYLQTLYYEMEVLRNWIRQYDLRIENIYVGGGTPTALPYEDFQELLQYIQREFVSPDLVEFTVEAGRPDTIDLAKSQLMAQYQVNRISINPQTMQDRTLEIIGRRHTASDITNAFVYARKAGIQHINADLIIGLPGETVADAIDSIQRLIALEPEDITLHALALKKGSELKMCYNDILLPSDECVQEMATVIVQNILEYGLHPYYMYRQGYMAGQLENVGYCKPGMESMYNIQIMGEQQTILGVGGAATSKITYPGQRLQTSFNAKDLHTYLSSIDKYIQRRSELLESMFGS